MRKIVVLAVLLLFTAASLPTSAFDAEHTHASASCCVDENVTVEDIDFVASEFSAANYSGTIGMTQSDAIQKAIEY